MPSRHPVEDLLQTNRFWLVDTVPSSTFPFFVLGAPIMGFQSITMPEITLETDEIIIKVDNPLWNLKSPHPLCPCGANMLDAYAEQLIKGTGNTFDYDYHDRLFNYEADRDPLDDSPIYCDQIETVIENMDVSSTTRRGIAITWHPYDQFGKCAVPCLQWIQFLVRDGKLQMKVLFRSNDVLLAMHANMYALVHLQQYVATALGLPVGSYTHIVTVPHIYYKRDANEVQKWTVAT